VAGQELVRREPVHRPRRAGEEAEQVDARRHLVDRGPDRLAGVRALEPPELIGTGLELVGELEQEQRAVLRGRLLPGLVGLRGRLHGAIDVFGSARRHVGDDLVVRRVDDLGGATVRGVDERATDELLVGLDALERFGHGTASWA
jgi:hypothetical protein